MKFYCYCCGKDIRKAFYLVTMQIPTDRVFLCCYNCIEQLDKDVIITSIIIDE